MGGGAGGIADGGGDAVFGDGDGAGGVAPAVGVEQVDQGGPLVVGHGQGGDGDGIVAFGQDQGRRAGRSWMATTRPLGRSPWSSVLLSTSESSLPSPAVWGSLVEGPGMSLWDSNAGGRRRAAEQRRGATSDLALESKSPPPWSEPTMHAAPGSVTAPTFEKDAASVEDTQANRSPRPSVSDRVSGAGGAGEWVFEALIVIYKLHFVGVFCLCLGLLIDQRCSTIYP